MIGIDKLIMYGRAIWGRGRSRAEPAATRAFKV